MTSALLILSTYITKVGTNLNYTIEQPQTILPDTITTLPTPIPTSTYKHFITPIFHQILAFFYFLLLGALVSDTNVFLKNVWRVSWLSNRVVLQRVRRDSEEIKILKGLIGEQRRVIRCLEEFVLELEGLCVGEERDVVEVWRLELRKEMLMRMI
jgi:hypothetical protein